ncbi:MAG: hypothetical protein ACYC6L_12705 [Anaerolineae bacterium]
MKKYDDVNPEQLKHLARLVDYARDTGRYTYFLEVIVDYKAFLYDSEGGCADDDAPAETVFYTGLHDLGFISINFDDDLYITLHQRAFDFVDYARLPRRKRRWEDLKWDLSHDNTIRSKIIWHTGSVLLAVLIPNLGIIIMKWLGWL